MGHQWLVRNTQYDVWHMVLDRYMVFVPVAICGCRSDLYAYTDAYTFGAPVSWSGRRFADRCSGAVGGERVNGFSLEPISQARSYSFRFYDHWAGHGLEPLSLPAVRHHTGGTRSSEREYE